VSSTTTKQEMSAPAACLNVTHEQKYITLNVCDSLADGFLAAADTTSTLAQLRTAVKAALSTGAPVHEETQKKPDALETRK
jgi:hypothetical protein